MKKARDGSRAFRFRGVMERSLGKAVREGGAQPVTRAVKAAKKETPTLGSAPSVSVMFKVQDLSRTRFERVTHALKGRCSTS